MLAQNPQRMDYYKKYQEIIADYNREKDRVTIEETFGRLVDFAAGLDAAQKQAAEEGLSQDEFALFQMLFKANISKADRERLKLASRDLLAALIAQDDKSSCQRPAHALVTENERNRERGPSAVSPRLSWPTDAQRHLRERDC